MSAESSPTPISAWAKWGVLAMLAYPALGALAAPVVIGALLFSSAPIGDGFFTGFMAVWISAVVCALAAASICVHDIWRSGVVGKSERVLWTVVAAFAMVIGPFV